jgi:Tol biopolymer transport system component
MKMLLLAALAGLSLVLPVACEGGGQETNPTAPSEAPVLSPEGTPIAGLGKLAYVQDGDIWVKDLPDGGPLRLTDDGGSSEPRWSPSGKWLAFRKGDEQVWVMRPDGTEAHLLDEAAHVTAFAWAPARDRLAFVAGGALVAVDADGSNRQELVAGTGGPGTGVFHATWSPDGDWLAYDRVDVLKEGEDGNPPERRASLWRVRVDGSAASEILNAGTPSSYGLTVAGWSPDGSHVLYWTDPGFSASLLADGAPLFAVPAEGGSTVQLADAVLLHSDFLVLGPAGGDQVAVVVGSYRRTSENKVLHVLSVSTGQDAVLTSPDVAVSSPAWSPDGQQIAYVAMPDEGDLRGAAPTREGLMQRRVFVANAEGEPQPRQLTDDPAYRDEYPLWSADGASILIARVDAEDRASLWLVPAAGGEPHQIVDELSPPPEPAQSWLGYYGHVDWDKLLDWWRGPTE